MIKKVLGILFFTLSALGTSFSQEEYLLLGEGREDEVRLFWTPTESWPSNLLGFNIKRKSEESWIKLNADVIVPGTSEQKSLTNLNFSNTEINRLRQKRSQLISAGTLKSLSTEDLIEIMASKDNVEGVSIMLNSDFDIALIAGFGFVDLNIESKTGTYTYGLFPVYDNGEAKEPVQEFVWEYGTSPTIVVEMEGNAKANSKRETVDLVYKIDTKSYRSYDILNGFNVLRKKEGEESFVKLNENPIWVSLKLDKATLYYKDEGVDLTEEYVYAVAPNTIFNTNGTLVEIKVAPPAEIDESVKPPVLQTPSVDETQGNIQLNWDFDQTFEESISGFYVQLKEKDGNLFNNISELLDPSVRTFEFDQPAADNAYYHFKVIALRKDDLELWSNRKIFFNKQNTKPGMPLNFQGSIEQNAIKLTWNEPTENAQSVVMYNLYTSGPNEDRLVREGSLQITAREHTYDIYRSKSAVYKFAVSASNSSHEESLMSDTLTIIFPSKSLPFVNIWPVSKQDNKVTLNWKYPDDIADLAGFRLYQNGELVFNQQILTSELRTWEIEELSAGTYTYELEAISLSGVTSEKSKPRTFEIE